MQVTSTVSKDPRESGDSSPGDVCQCDHMRETHALFGVCCMYGCPCKGFQLHPKHPYEGEQGNCLHDSTTCVECGMRFPRLSMVRHMRQAHPDPLEDKPAFKQGDEVRRISNGDAMTIEWGPLTAYVVSDATGDSIVVNADLIEPIPPTDPRVEVARQAVVRSWDSDLDAEQEARAVLAALEALEAS